MNVHNEGKGQRRQKILRQDWETGLAKVQFSSVAQSL